MLFRDGATSLVVEGDAQEKPEVELSSGETLIPYSPQNNLLTHRVVLLASEVGQCSAASDLLSSIRSFIHRYVDLSESFEAVAAAYVLFTWVYDEFEEVPYLRVRGDYGCGKSRFLQTIGSLCYKPIFASGASTVSPLFRLLDAVQGTLVLDESDFRFSDETAEIIKILNNGNAQGFPVLRSEQTPQKEFNPRAFRVFGPKVIATRRRFDDEALESRCISEVLGRKAVREDIPLNLPRAFHTEAEAIRNRLLAFRLHLGTTDFATERIAVPGLMPRRLQVVRPLVAATPEESRREILEALGTKRGDRRDAPVLRRLLEVLVELRSRGERAISLKELSRSFSARSDGADNPVSPRWIGGLLRRDLDLIPGKRNGVYVLPSTCYAAIDELAKIHGVEVDVREHRDEERG